MPLDKNMSHEEMVSELIKGYKKTGKIGDTKPKNMKHALEIANAVAYNIGESAEKNKVQEVKLDELLKSLESVIADKEKELGIVNETSVKVEFDNGETIETEVSKDATDDDIKNYYAVGKEFNLGQGGRDRMAKVKNVSVTRNVGECMQLLPVEMEFSDEEDCCLEDTIDILALDVPLFIRLLEWAREEAKDDVDLHVVTENAIKIMQNNTEFLTMDDYSEIIPAEQEVIDLSGEEENAMAEMDMGDMGADPVQPMKSKKFKRRKIKRK